MIVPFLIVFWFVGFIVSIVHELSHVIVLGETPQNISVGIPITIKFTFQRFTLYPLLPFCGSVEMELTKHPSRFRMACFTIAGCLAGLLTSVLCGYIGFHLLPTEDLTELLNSGYRPGFLLRAVVHGTATLQSTIATALVSAGFCLGVQQISNLAPIPKYDGYNFIRVLFHKS